jgi:hypothetical protein
MTELERAGGESAASGARAVKARFLAGPVARVVMPAGYRLNLVAVVFAMVLFPHIYLAVIAAAAAGALLNFAYVWPQLAALKCWQIDLIVGGGPPIAGPVLVGHILRLMWPRGRAGASGDRARLWRRTGAT